MAESSETPVRTSSYHAKAVFAIAIAMAAFHLYAVVRHVDAMVHRSVHVGFALVLVFMLYPAFKKATGGKKKDYNTWVDWLFIAGSVGSVAYICVNYDYVVNRMLYVTPIRTLDAVFCGVVVFLIVEAVRRTIGWSLVSVALVFLLYAAFGRHLPGILRHGGISFANLVDMLYLSTNGVYGSNTEVSATYIILFVMLGSMLTAAGIGKLFSNLADALTAKLKSGPAAAAVVSSALFGTVSGSATANVYTTGVFSIPAMKRAGYQPYFAGAVEAVASCGGQITPPVLGAAAFVVSDMTGIPYLKLCVATILPAIIYYYCVFLTIHLRAYKLDAKPLQDLATLSVGKTLLDYGHLFIPIITLVMMMVHGYTATMAAFTATVVTPIVAALRKETRMGPKAILDALADSSINVLSIAMACTVAGLVMGVISMTGVGFKFISLVMAFAGSSILIALVIVAVTCLILGMGLPTLSAYVLVAALAAPALYRLKLAPLEVNLFIFYFASISAITPPVALAAYAGANIAGAGMMKTGAMASRLGIVAFIIPFYFCYDTSILLEHGVWAGIVTMLLFMAGMFGFIVGAEGWFIKFMNPLSRVLLIAAGLACAVPNMTVQLAGIGAVVAVLLVTLALTRNEKAVATQSS